MKLLFIFTGSKLKPARLTEGMLKVISRSKRATTLSLAPALFNAGQYQLIFSKLEKLRHLHLENLRHLHLDGGQPLNYKQPCAEPPKHLTRLTFYMRGAGEDSAWFRSILKSSASTLEELQVLGQTDAILSEALPRLTVLRVTADVVDEGHFYRTLRLVCHLLLLSCNRRG